MGAAPVSPRMVGAPHQILIEEQYAFAAEVIKVFGQAHGIPRQIPHGTFDTSYAR